MAPDGLVATERSAAPDVTRVFVLGPLVVTAGERSLSNFGHDEGAMLARLALSPTGCTYPELAEAIWGSSDPHGRGAQQIHPLVRRLRRAVGQSAIKNEYARGYRLGDNVTTDVADFDDLREKARAEENAPGARLQAFTRALALWRGDPTEFKEYKHFSDLLAKYSRTHYRLLAESYAALLLREGADSITLQLAADTLRDAGADPELRAKLEEQIAAGGQAPIPASNLGAPQVLYGRDSEVQEACSYLRDGRRLVTVWGSPGIGKTALSKAVAHALLGNEPFEQRVWFIDLTKETVADTILARIGERLDRPTERALLTWLKSNPRTVIVLDNLEQLLPAGAAHISGLLQECPQVSLLVTSTAQLGVDEPPETLVHPLPLDYQSAISLFRDEAGRYGERASDEEIGAISDIVGFLPLGIRLAAAAVRTLPASAVLRDLRAQPFVIDRLARAHDKKKQLGGTINWSVTLKSPAAQRLLRFIAAFPGGLAYEDLERSWNDAADNIADNARAAPLMGELVSGALVEYDGDRYSLLTPIRNYALETPSDAMKAASDVLKLRTEDCLVQLATTKVAKFEALIGSQRHGAAIALLRTERPNISAALDRLNSAHRLDDAFDLTTALAEYWIAIGDWQDGQAAFERLLNQNGGTAKKRAEALARVGGLARNQGMFDTARQYYHKAIDLSRPNYPWSWRYGLNGLGRIEAALGPDHYDKAKDHYCQALKVGRRMAHDIMRRERETGKPGRPWSSSVAVTLTNLGDLALLQLRFATTPGKRLDLLNEAERHHRWAHRIRESEGDALGIAVSHLRLAAVALEKGDLSTSLGFARDSLARFTRQQHEDWIARGLEMASQVAARDGQYETALSLDAAAARLDDRHGTRQSDFEADQRRVLRETWRAAAEESPAMAAAAPLRPHDIAAAVSYARSFGLSGNPPIEHDCHNKTNHETNV